MIKPQNIKKKGARLLAGLALFLIPSCGVHNSADSFNTWTFSGQVVDGYSGKPLSDVRISFRKEDGTEAGFTTGSTGEFFINSIPYGEKTFRFDHQPPDSATPKAGYTQKVMVVSNWSSGVGSAPEGEVGDASKIVKLFPLSGALRGSAAIKLAGSQLVVPAQRTLVKIVFTGADMTDCFPRVFEITTDDDGAFGIDSLPLSDPIDQTVFDVILDGTRYTTAKPTAPVLFAGKLVTQPVIYLTAGDTTNIKINKVASNVLSADGFGLTGVPVDLTPYYVLPVKPVPASVEALIEGKEVTVKVKGDTVFVDPVQDLDYNSKVTVTLTGRDSTGSRIQFVFDGPKQFQTSRGVYVKASNVWTPAHKPATDVSVGITPWYVLSSKPEPGSLKATITGGGSPKALVTVSGDTVFVDPVVSFDYESDIAVSLEGLDKDGERIAIDMADALRFRTERNVFPVASNTWDISGRPVQNFGLFDTMWVAFSEPLKSDPALIQWWPSGADNDIFGSGAGKNAEVRISKDTLYVVPDPRLPLGFGQTMGFRVSVLSESGKRSDSLDFTARLLESGYQVKWSNTRDQFGNMRDDFKVSDSVVLVSSLPIKQITGISGVTGATTPADMTLDNVNLKGDTIVFKPGIRLEPNTKYGMDFDLVFKNGVVLKDALPVTWQTKVGVRILATNNRENGHFRAFKAIGDSLQVTFSEPIDTSAKANIPFKVNMRDVKSSPVSTRASWNPARTQVTLVILDSLPLAAYNASPAYTSNSPDTRAVAEVTFDLTTASHEEVFQLAPANEKIEIHTEEGLAAIESNILRKHLAKQPIATTEETRDDFDRDDPVRVTFNRAMDAATMSLYGLTTFGGIQDDESGLNLPCSVSFGDSNKTLIIKPAKSLRNGKKYHVWVKNVLGGGIHGCPAISLHGGRFSGAGTANSLVNAAFLTKSPNISAATVAIAPDSNTVAGVGGSRLGLSEGFAYSQVVGEPNTNSAKSLRFRITETAWNANHQDSVEGYQIQIQGVDRSGNETNWYDYPSTVASIPWTPLLAGPKHVTEAALAFISTPLYNLFLKPDGDASGSFYLNQPAIFNDSSQIRVRARPFVGSGDPGRNEVGEWSDPVVFVDNVAPCDSDFVGASNCANLTRGGVQVNESVDFDNAGAAGPDETGFIDVTFPEDMNPGGPAPKLTFYYGPFGGTNPTEPLTVLPQSNWITARKYRFQISIPAFDYTHAKSGNGAYYSLSVAGVVDAGGNAVQTFGSDGNIAVKDYTAAGRPNRNAAAAAQAVGSSSVQAGFVLCD